MELQKMYELDKKATKALYDQIKNIEGIELRENNDGITFKYKGHTFIFTAELED